MNALLSDVLDRATLSRLKSIIGDGPDGIGGVIDAFREEAPSRIREMRAAFDKGDADAVGRAAHSVKGSGRTIGARALAEVCAAIEDLAREGKLAEAAPLVAKAEELLPETLRRLAERQ